MAITTRWDPFQDLRSAQDEMDQMSPMLAHALGLHPSRAVVGPRPRPGRRSGPPAPPRYDSTGRRER
jgi:hypothetical protein